MALIACTHVPGAAAVQNANDMVHQHCMSTWIVLGLPMACLCCCIYYVCRAKVNDESGAHWLRDAQNRKMKRKWVRLGKGRLTPDTMVLTKQLNSMHCKGKGELPMHTLSAKAGEPSNQHRYKNKNTWGNKVFATLIKIVNTSKCNSVVGQPLVVSMPKGILECA